MKKEYMYLVAGVIIGVYVVPKLPIKLPGA
jgi:hypothetical protein